MKKKKRNRVILAICSMFIACMSIFAFIPKEKEIVKADGITTSYFTYSSSNYQLAYSICTSQNLNSIQSGFDYGAFSFIFSNDLYYTTSDKLYFSLNFQHYVSGTGFVTDNVSTRSIPYDDSTAIWLDIGVGYLPAEIYCSSAFNFSPVRLLLGSSWNADLNVGYNKFIYYDENGNYLSLYTGYYNTGSNYYSGLVLADRLYYLTANYTEDYTDGYNNGKNEGFIEGEIEGRNEGYTQGYNVGKNDGYNLGYNEALTNSDKYTFDNLLSAVIDVPVRTFTSLFNFDILGVNLSGFFLGLLTCCIVITIVRLLL